MNMKKTLIAAGVAAAMVVPMAASADVSLTARLQAELTHSSGDFAEGLRIGDAMQGPRQCQLRQLEPRGPAYQP
jgi:hypothetical protein